MRERGVVEEPIGGEALERIGDGVLVVLLGEESAAQLIAAPRAVAEQAIGVAHDALGGRSGADLGDVRVAQFPALEQPPASHE